MKKLLSMLMIISLISCADEKKRHFHYPTTTKMELRQLINKEEINKSSSGSYFLIVANYSTNENKEDIIKMFVKVDNSYYKMLKLNLEDVNIVVNNKISKPYLKITESSESIYNRTDSEILNFIEYNDKIFLYCPEKYLPEKLLNIELQ